MPAPTLQTGSGGPLSTPAEVGFFGTFFPEYQKAGNSSVGLVYLLARSSRVRQIVVFGQQGSRLPDGLNSAKVELRPTWEFDSPISLIRTMLLMLRGRRSFSLYLFNIYMTSFGRGLVRNAFGLLLPPALALAARRPVLVYMHNFLTTQDVVSLGYVPRLPVRWAARILERLLLTRTRVVVPLESQALALENQYGIRVTSIFVPGTEVIATIGRDASLEAHPGNKGARRVLCLGNWGPQKDLDGAIEALIALSKELGEEFGATIAGTANSNFPIYAEKLASWKARLAGSRIIFLGAVEESKVRSLMEAHDVLLLPYLATGGYSGAMNASVGTGIRLVAYDLPQLRETAGNLGLSCSFVPSGDRVGLVSALRQALSMGREEEVVSGRIRGGLLDSADDAVARILSKAVSLDRRDVRPPP